MTDEAERQAEEAERQAEEAERDAERAEREARRDAGGDETDSRLEAAREKLEAARKALQDATDNPREGEVQRVGKVGGGTRPVPSEDYQKRIAALEENVRKAEEELRAAER